MQTSWHPTHSSSPTPTGRDPHPRKFAPESLQSRDYLRESKDLRQMKEDMLRQFSQPSTTQQLPTQSGRPLY
jgi:hypothetical protein